MQAFFRTIRPAIAALILACAPAQLAAQTLETVDPDASIYADGAPQGSGAPSPGVDLPSADPAQADLLPADSAIAPTPTPVTATPATTASATTTYKQDDLIGAAEGVFGKGAEGLAKMIQDLLAKQGEPNAYIIGREGGGAFMIGARYGSGTMYHKVEGEMPVYWRGPSFGVDVGANAASTFVLVYNLFDAEELFKRYGAGEGQAYLIGGFHISYLRRGDVVLIPIRMGAGLRLGLNVGYMKFSKKQNWLPF
jgi:hypothetical protein